jgi:hypothetical protein
LSSPSGLTTTVHRGWSPPALGPYATKATVEVARSLQPSKPKYVHETGSCA